MTFYIWENVQYTTELTALNTVSHNAMNLTWPSISGVMNEPDTESEIKSFSWQMLVGFDNWLLLS